MDNKLFLLALTCLLASPIAAMEEGWAAAESSADQITITFQDDLENKEPRELNLDKAKFLPILQQSKTISDLLEDVQTDVIAFPLPNMTKGEFEQALSLMTLDGPSSSQVLADFDIKKLSTYWNIFNYLDVPGLLKLLNAKLEEKLLEVKSKRKEIPKLLNELPSEFKRTKVSSSQLKSLLPESIKNKLIGKLTTLKGHGKAVNSVAFDLKHNLLATGELDGTVNIYTISDKNEISLLTTLDDHGKAVNSVAFDPSHNLLATGSWDGTVNIYTISDKNEISLLTTLKDHTKEVSSVAFDPSHNLLATGSWDGTVNIYTISDNNEISLLTTLKDHTKEVSSVAFDPSHNLLATGSSDGVNIYTISDNNEISLLTTLKDHTEAVNSVDFDPTHNLLATGAWDGAVNIYTISDNNEISLLTTLKDHTAGVFSVDFDPTHNLLATGSWDGAVNIYTISDKNEVSLLTTLKGHYQVVHSVAFDPSQNLLATGSEDGRVIIYDLRLLNAFSNFSVGQALAASYFLEVKPKAVDAAPQIIQDQINSDPSVRQWFDDYLKKEETDAVSMVFQAIKRIFGR